MKTTSLVTSIILLFFAGCLGVYAEDSVQSKHHLELSISEGMSVIRNELQTGGHSALYHETLNESQNGGYKVSNLKLFPINVDV